MPLRPPIWREIQALDEQICRLLQTNLDSAVLSPVTQERLQQRGRQRRSGLNLKYVAACVICLVALILAIRPVQHLLSQWQPLPQGTQSQPAAIVTPTLVPSPTLAPDDATATAAVLAATAQRATLTATDTAPQASQTAEIEATMRAWTPLPTIGEETARAWTPTPSTDWRASPTPTESLYGTAQSLPPVSGTPTTTSTANLPPGEMFVTATPTTGPSATPTATPAQ